MGDMHETRSQVPTDTEFWCESGTLGRISAFVDCGNERLPAGQETSNEPRGAGFTVRDRAPSRGSAFRFVGRHPGVALPPPASLDPGLTESRPFRGFPMPFHSAVSVPAGGGAVAGRTGKSDHRGQG